MLQDFQYVINFNITVGDALENIFAALICGLLVTLFYKLCYRGPGYSVSFMNSMVALCMITAIVIMVIGNNLARAFGLVGAMSIIRFRTAVKETLDIVFIFFALAMGLAAGVGFHFISIVSTLTIGGILFVLSKYNVVSAVRRDFLLQFTYDTIEGGEEAPYSRVLNKYCRRVNLMNIKSSGDEPMLELSYYVKLKDDSRNAEFIKDLKQIPGVNHINLYFDEENF